MTYWAIPVSYADIAYILSVIVELVGILFTINAFLRLSLVQLLVVMANSLVKGKLASARAEISVLSMEKKIVAVRGISLIFLGTTLQMLIFVISKIGTI